MSPDGRGVDFEALRAGHPIVETIGRYLELTRKGGEYKALCPFHADKQPSFSVVPSKSKAFCNACGWHGDVVDFIAEYDGVTLAEAALRLSGGELPNDRPAPANLPPDTAGEWTPILPAPADAPAYDPARTWNPRSVDRKTNTSGRFVNWSRSLVRQDVYRDASGAILGYVIRMEIDGQKLTPTVVYARHKDGREAWISGKFPSPRPLQGLDDLARRPTAAVLVVSGEKCRDVASRTLPGFVSVTWAGGDNNVLKADWSPLRGRRVTIWPDADQSGIDAGNALAGALQALGVAEVRIINPTGKPKGWDIADGVEQAAARGLTGVDLTAAIVAWVKPRVSGWGAEPVPPDGGGEVEPPSVPPVPEPASVTVVEPPLPPPPPPAATAVTGEIVDLPPSAPPDYATAGWLELGLELGGNGIPAPNLSNAVAVLERHPAFSGRFWFDEFLGRILTTWNVTGTEQEWSDSDDVRLALAMQRQVRIGKMMVGTVRDAVTAIAMAHRRNEAQAWLLSLRWDGTDRLRHLVPEAFGTARNAYTEAVGRCWLVSMVARVLRPGCKVDTMPVFEGLQGRGKSTALRVLVGDRWFAEASESPTSKDFFQALQGKMLVEIGEMDAFSRSEVHTIKRVITCQSDRYRAPYGRRAEDHPRMCVFAGTTNRDDWNKDETGARRFWPVACSDVSIDWLVANREQLFAEAMARLSAGESWWDVPAEDAMREQEDRREFDEWEDVIRDWLVGRNEVTVGDVLRGALSLQPDKWDKPAQMRAAKAMRTMGWRRKTIRRGGNTMKVWRREGATAGLFDADFSGGNGGNESPL